MIQKMKKNIQNLRYLPHTMSFVIPSAILLGISIGMGVYPFGEKDFLHMDAYHQYGPFFLEFTRMLKEGKSLSYTWNLGLGSDFVSLYAYYLASPWNLLLYFIPESHVIEFMDYTILLRMGFCGFSFFYFLNERFSLRGKDGRYHARTVIPALSCSTAYALCGFSAAYSWDIMWMDSVALAPLIFLGIERILTKKKPALYFVSLAWSIFANYYISIMICIFAVFYFLIRFVEEKEKKVADVGRFALYSLCAGGCSGVLLLPEMAVLGASGSAAKGFPETMKWYFGIFETIARGCTVATCYKGNDHWPNLYAGSFVFLVLFLYLLNKRIHWGKKLSRGLMVLFFWISFSNNYLDFLWHGFHFPQALPGRQSFLFAFLLLVMTFEVCRYWKGIRVWHLPLALSLGYLLLYLGYGRSDAAVTEGYAFLATAGFMLCYFILFFVMKITKSHGRMLLTGFAFAIVLIELTVNMAVTGLCTSNRRLYLNKMESYKILLEQAAKEAGNEFYRVEDVERKTKNDAMLYGYSSATIFSSLMNLEVSHLYQDLYMEGGLNYYCYNGATPLTSAMLSVKYMLSDSPYEESKLRRLVGSHNGQYLYENSYYLPLGFMMTDEQIEKFDNDSQWGKLTRLNNFAGAFAEGTMLYAVDSMVEQNIGAGETVLTVASDGYYYASYVNCKQNNLTIKNTRSGYQKTYGKTTHRYLLELGECKAGDVIKITNAGKESIEFRTYQMNMKVVDAAYGKMKEQVMDMEEWTEERILGQINVQTEGNLILSIPADKGWHVYVDGEEMQMQTFKEAFIRIPLTEGQHEISLEYRTPGFLPGILISISSLLLGIFGCVLNRILRERKQALCVKNS